MNLPLVLKCFVYCSSECAAKDWKEGRKGLAPPHKRVCHKLVRQHGLCIVIGSYCEQALRSKSG
jgi:hypothetical protein